MRKVLITTAIVLMLSCITSNIHAQTTAQDPLVTLPKLNLTLEQRYIVKEIIKDMKIEPAPAKVQAVGDQVPDNIRLQPIPSDVAQKASRVDEHKSRPTSLIEQVGLADQFATVLLKQRLHFLQNSAR